MKNNLSRLMVLVVLIIVVAVVLITKNRNAQKAPDAEPLTKEVISEAKTSESEKDDRVESNVEAVKLKSVQQNPVMEALKNGKPTVLDLGAGTCIPCKMMKPIFDELEKEYKDRANIIILEVSEHIDLARKYQIRVIPTQIFIDREGQEYWRHEGFLSKDDIIKKLGEMGIE